MHLSVFMAIVQLWHSADCPSPSFDSNSDTSDKIEPRMLHLRNREPREWSDFPEMPDAKQLELTFNVANKDHEFTLSWRQQDVKQMWTVRLNDKQIGELVRDENDMVVYVHLAAGTLAKGDNVLSIKAAPTLEATDDIRIGQITLDSRPMNEVLNEGAIDIAVMDGDVSKPVPCRLTIIDENGSLQTTGAKSNDELAVRPGVIYAATGHANVGLPAGRYTVFAGRGFEYSLAQTQVTVVSGRTATCTMSIRREVPTDGYVACDTHVHTLTHSGHGDATVAERLITLAGEGIELPIATDHNIHVDYDPLARRMNLRQYFTPVIGNEVTTTVGHFNVFPVRLGARVPDYKSRDWKTIFDEIYSTPGVKVAILNHARDLHADTRPFDPKLHNAAVGENLAGWPMRFNAMEVINSSATQSDVFRLFHDWMALLNRGHTVTPVGSSDSHDVARHFVGQGRTYIRCDDHDPGQIDVDAAVNSFLHGHVLVSYGLIAQLTVNDQYRSGDLAPLTDDDVHVDVRVLGPRWVHASQVRLYSNGSLIREQQLNDVPSDQLSSGIAWQGRWTLPRPKHDVHLVAIVVGKGINGPFWKTAKAYQPISADWQPHTIGCSGAIWLDGDGDGRRTSPREYAERLVNASQSDLTKLMQGLAAYDEGTAAQAAHLLRVSGESLESDRVEHALKSAASHVQAGFRAYMKQ